MVFGHTRELRKRKSDVKIYVSHDKIPITISPWRPEIVLEGWDTYEAFFQKNQQKKCGNLTYYIYSFDYF